MKAFTLKQLLDRFPDAVVDGYVNAKNKVVKGPPKAGRQMYAAFGESAHGSPLTILFPYAWVWREADSTLDNTVFSIALDECSKLHRCANGRSLAEIPRAKRDSI